MPGDLSTVQTLEILGVVLAALLLLAAAVQDMRQFKISNNFSLALVALFFVYAIIAGLPFIPYVITGIAVLAAGFALFALRLLGGGDVKLMAATALWAGAGHVTVFLLATTFLGGVLAFVYAGMALMRHKKAEKNYKGLDGIKAEDKATPWQKAPVPYGVAIACGGWIVLFQIGHKLFT